MTMGNNDIELLKGFLQSWDWCSETEILYIPVLQITGVLKIDWHVMIDFGGLAWLISHCLVITDLPGYNLYAVFIYN